MISHLLNEDVDVVNIHLVSNKNIDKNYIDLNLEKEFIEDCISKYKFMNKRNMVLYYRKNMYYSYDTSNDAQVIMRFYLLNSEIIKISDEYSICVNTYKEQKLPCYMFSSTNDIDDKVKMRIEEYKVNNRIILTKKDENSLYLVYKHSTNVDIEKNMSDLKNFIENIL